MKIRAYKLVITDEGGNQLIERVSDSPGWELTEEDIDTLEVGRYDWDYMSGKCKVYIMLVDEVGDTWPFTSEHLADDLI